MTGNYWNYATSADNGVSNQLIDPDPGNNATFSVGQLSTIGAPYYRTEAGAHENSVSAYGTFDQSGNLQEFTEAVPESDIRRIRGGSWLWGRTYMSASEVDDVMHSSDQLDDLGFRLVLLGPDPVSVSPVGKRAGPRFAITGAHPFREEARFSIELPIAGRAHIDVFDVAGRRLPGSIDRALSAGANEVVWKTDGLAPGVYLARLRADGQSAVVRFVRIR
jgi:hypothetical protein